jgi:hypothetical protein
LMSAIDFHPGFLSTCSVGRANRSAWLPSSSAHFTVVPFDALRPAPRHVLRLIGFADLKFV